MPSSRESVFSFWNSRDNPNVLETLGALTSKGRSAISHDVRFASFQLLLSFLSFIP